MEYSSIKDLALDFYSKLMDFRGAIQGKGLECGARIVKQPIGSDLRLDFTNLGTNLRDAQRIARGTMQRTEAIFSQYNIPYQPKEVIPTTSTMLVLSEDFCSRCQKTKPILTNYHSLSDEKCFSRLNQYFYQDQRRALLALRFFIRECERREWIQTQLQLDILAELNNAYGVTLWSYGCSIGTQMSADSRRGKKTSEIVIRRRIAKPLFTEAVGFGFNRSLCSKCQKNLITV